MSGCHLVNNIDTCVGGRACPEGLVCDEQRGLCGAPDAEPDPRPTRPLPIPNDPNDPNDPDDPDPPVDPIDDPPVDPPVDPDPDPPVDPDPVGPVISCGDGIVNGDENCDDANNVSGDNCSATCWGEGAPQFGEVEDNEDYIIDDVPYVDAAWSWTMTGALIQYEEFGQMVSDHDFFMIDMSVQVSPVIRIETFDQLEADDCLGALPFAIELYDGDVIGNFRRGAAQNAGATTACAALTVHIDDTETYAALVTPNVLFPATLDIPFYRVQVTPLEDRGDEIEPNDSFVDANDHVSDGLDVYASGSVQGTDIDTWEIVIPPQQSMRVELIPDNNDLQYCDFFAGQIAIHDENEAFLAAWGPMFGNCPYVDGRVDEYVHNTTGSPMTRYVRVSAMGAAPLPVTYDLAVTVR